MGPFTPAAFSLLIGLIAPPTVASEAPDPPDSAQALKRLSIEELSKIDVTSVSKHAEAISEAATAITVITSEDIRRAGITDVPDALRLATGVEVAKFNGETWGVSARGFNISTANKMQVLIDGRSVYTPLFSGVFWGVQDLVLRDVDRIEVIRGPGGTLWGANAVNGVINIITKSSQDTQGGVATVSGGNQVGQTSVRYGGKGSEDTTYRVYGKFAYSGAEVFSTGASSHDRTTHEQSGFRLDWRPPSRTTFTLQGDVYRGRSGLSDRPDIAEAGGNVLGRYSHTARSGSQLEVQGYYDGTFRDVPNQFSEHRDTLDAELQYRFTLGTRHDVTAGGGYRWSRGDAEPSPVLFFDPDRRGSHLVNTFVQDAIALVPNRIVLTVGSKLEQNDFTGFEVQPTARIRWSPTPRQTVWGGVSRAVRMPSRFDSDLRFTGGNPFVLLQGSPAFQSENVVATEAGYRVRLANVVAVDVATFVNDYNDLRSEEPSVTPPGIPLTLANRLLATTGGVEVAVDYQPTSRLQWHLAYTRLAEDFHLEAGSLDPTGGSGEHNDPQNQFLLRASCDLPRHSELDAVLRVVGALPNPVVPGYTELTLRAGWGHDGPVEIALIGDNLLHARHGEAAATGPLQEQYVRQATVRVTVRF
jgi:iron complex outermembrane receptor protein